MAFRRTAISSVATFESFMAVGSSDGMLHLMKQQPTKKNSTNDPSGDTQGGCEGTAEGKADRETSSLQYDICGSQQCYISQIDAVYNTEFLTAVNSIFFVPSLSRKPLLMVANERTPKLYKLVELQSPPPVRTTVSDFLRSRQLPRLCGPPVGKRADRSASSVTLCRVASFTDGHESTITSMSPVGVGAEQFASADEFTIRLWSVEHPEASVETFSLLSVDEGRSIFRPTEVVRSLQCFPHCPSLLFAVMSSTVYIFDTRQSLEWRRNSVALDFSVAPEPVVVDDLQQEYQWELGGSLLSDCALSPSGVNLAVRNFKVLTVLDLRRCQQHKVNAVNRWTLHHHSPPRHSDAYLERFQLQFLNDATIVTGGLRSELHVIDLQQQQYASDGSGPSRVLTAVLPPLKQFTRKQELSLREEESTAGTPYRSTQLHEGEGRPWQSAISRPHLMQCHPDESHFFVSSGAALMHLSYAAVA